ncbi:MAG: membrane protein insertase YidC [Rubricoccaceae bacterium]
MQQQGIDRTTLIGILLISVILGVWMMWTAPPAPTPPDAPAAATQDAAAADDEADEPTIGPAEDAEAALRAPADTLFAAAVAGPERTVVVTTDAYQATFSTRGGTLRAFELKDYRQAANPEAPVNLVSNERGALALVFTPASGGLVDSRTLSFRPVVDGAPFAGDTLRVDSGEATLAFEAVVGEGAIRLVYSFRADSYDVGFRVETPGTDVLERAGGFELVWDGALPLAEAQPREEAGKAGAYVRLGGETDVLRLSGPGQAEPILRTGQVDWVAVKTKFFIAALIPARGQATEGAELTGRQIGSVDSPDSFAQSYTARLELPGLPPNEAAAFTLYLGPLEIRRLAAYGLYDTVEFGFGQTLTRPIARYIIAPTFAFLSAFIPNYGFVIILFALLVKLVLWPLTSVSFRNAARMRELQPKMEAIKEKYADDPQKQQEAMMRMYREAGVNPLGGCLPMLLQYPILIALWQFFQNTLVLRQEGFLWARDLSAPDPILNLPFAIPFYGDYVAGFTLVMGLSMILQMRVSMAGGGAAMPGQQKVIMYTLPLVFFLFFNGFPSGLSLYYLAFNVFSIAQQKWINDRVKLESASKDLKADPARVRPAGTTNGRAKTPARASAKPRRRGAGSRR